MRFPVLMGAALLAAATALHAQTDDKSARREQMKEAHQKAAKACEGAQGAERAACMQRELCAQSKDPKACNERIAKGKESFAKARKACEAKPEGERVQKATREISWKAGIIVREENHAHVY